MTSFCHLTDPGSYQDEDKSTAPKTCPGLKKADFGIIIYSKNLFERKLIILLQVGHQCPGQGLKEPEECSPGTFQNETGKIFCYDCKPGYACSGTENIICEQGYI